MVICVTRSSWNDLVVCWCLSLVRNMWGVNIVGLVSVLVIVGVVDGVIEFCSPGRTDAVYRITKQDCPYGVLFTIPVDTTCFQSNDADVDNYVSNLCKNVPFSSNPKQIQVISSIDDSEVPESCAGESSGTTMKCNTSQVILLTKDTLTPPILSGSQKFVRGEDFEVMGDEVAPPEYRNDSKVYMQTKRLFKYLINLEYPSEEELEELNKLGTPDGIVSNFVQKELYATLKSPPRIVKLLEMSFSILHKHVDHRWVPRDFKNDVEHAFVFLVKEAFQASGAIGDLPEEDYEKIKTSLESCQAHEVPFEIVGKRCRTYSTIESLSKEGKKMLPKQDEFSFKWGLYDLPLDATWATLDFVHGLCYGTFKEHVNSHHLYERAVERLFNLHEMTYRWQRPPKLHDERLWSKMFSTSSPKQTMKNLDAFTQAAYYGSPFMHRLERSFIKYPGLTGAPGETLNEDEEADTVFAPVKPVQVLNADEVAPGGSSGPGAAPSGSPAAAPASPTGDPAATTPAPPARRKRSGFSGGQDFMPTLQELGMKGGGWCFQSEAEQRSTILTLIFEKCEGDLISKDFKNALPWLFSSDKEGSSKDEL